MNTFKKIALAVAISATIFGTANTQNSYYESAQKAMHSQSYKKAYELFKQAETDEKYTESSMYWQAYTLFQLKQKSKARKILNSLLEQYPNSQWNDNAKVLLFENRDRNLFSEDQNLLDNNFDRLFDENLRLQKIQENFFKNPKQGYKEITDLVETAKDMVTKVNAIQMLGMSDLKEAQDYLFNYIQNNKNKDLNNLAIQMLSIRNNKESLEQLVKLYKKSNDKDQKKSILHGFIHSEDSEKLMSLMNEETDTELNKEIINLLGIFGATKELKDLANSDLNPNLNKSLLEALAIGGDVDSIKNIIESSKDANKKIDAIHSLAITNGDDIKPFLLDLYKKNNEKQITEALISSLSIAGLSSEEAIDLVKTEKDEKSKINLLNHLYPNLNIKDLLELSKGENNPKLNNHLLHFLATKGGSDEIINLYKNMKDVESKREAINALSIIPNEDSKEFLINLYKDASTAQVIKKGIVDGFMVKKDTDVLTALLANEKDMELKKAIIQAISLSDPESLIEKIQQEK